MILLKACATCGGDVQPRRNADGVEFRCILCSRTLDLKSAAVLIQQRKTAA